jgi:Ni/Co efflux regulator RcnB
MRRWGRGDVVPWPYRGQQYIVTDWRMHRLSPPPRGYQWVSVGPDYFLINIVTGMVLQSILY